MRGTRGTPVVLVAALLVITLPAAVWAAATAESQPVNQQVVTVRSDDITTSSAKWTDIVEVEAWCPANKLGVASLNLSIKGGSAPVLVRVLAERLPQPNFGDADVLTARPNAVPFAVSASDSRSFTFSAPLDRSGGVGRRLIAQWRSPTGRPARVSAATMHLLYAHTGEACL